MYLVVMGKGSEHIFYLSWWKQYAAMMLHFTKSFSVLLVLWLV